MRKTGSYTRNQAICGRGWCRISAASLGGREGEILTITRMGQKLLGQNIVNWHYIRKVSSMRVASLAGESARQSMPGLH
jgi:hypothetical protein